MADRYVVPTWFERNVGNRVVRGATKLGVSLRGSRVLRVKGRRSGEVRTTVVNLLDLDGARYLVAPRGTTQWVRNARAAGAVELQLGRSVESVRLVELADDDKPSVLRAYLRRWKTEVGRFFAGVGPDASDEELLAIAPGYPVFRLHA